MSAIYFRHRNIKIVQNKIQLLVNWTQNCCNDNRFKISTNKMTGVISSRRNNLPRIVLKIDQDQIKMENGVEFLGVVSDRKLCYTLII